jgi:hypothetical protein
MKYLLNNYNLRYFLIIILMLKRNVVFLYFLFLQLSTANYFIATKLINSELSGTDIAKEHLINSTLWFISLYVINYNLYNKLNNLPKLNAWLFNKAVGISRNPYFLKASMYILTGGVRFFNSGFYLNMRSRLSDMYKFFRPIKYELFVVHENNIVKMKEYKNVDELIRYIKDFLHVLNTSQKFNHQNNKLYLKYGENVCLISPMEDDKYIEFINSIKEGVQEHFLDNNVLCVSYNETIELTNEYGIGRLLNDKTTFRDLVYMNYIKNLKTGAINIDENKQVELFMMDGNLEFKSLNDLIR